MKCQKSNSGGPKYNVTDSRMGKQVRGHNKFPERRVGAKSRRAAVFDSKYTRHMCRDDGTNLFKRETRRAGMEVRTTVQDEAGGSEIVEFTLCQWPPDVSD